MSIAPRVHCIAERSALVGATGALRIAERGGAAGPVTEGAGRTRRAATALDGARARPRTWGQARLLLLQARGVGLAEIARAVGKDLSFVSRVNRGRRRSAAIERGIARHWPRRTRSPSGIARRREPPDRRGGRPAAMIRPPC